MEDIKANINIPSKTLNDLLLSRYVVQMATSTLYVMKNWVLKEINGGHDESYSFLPKYCAMMKQTNPSAAFCAWVPQSHPERPLTFSSIFISFKGAVDELFGGCKRYILLL